MIKWKVRVLGNKWFLLWISKRKMFWWTKFVGDLGGTICNVSCGGILSFSTGSRRIAIFEIQFKGTDLPSLKLLASSHLKRGAAFSACFLDISPRRRRGWGDSDSWFWIFQDLSLFGKVEVVFQESLWFWRRQSLPKDSWPFYNVTMWSSLQQSSRQVDICAWCSNTVRERYTSNKKHQRVNHWHYC